MSIGSIIAIHRASRLAKRENKDKAAEILRAAMGRWAGDFRLAIRLGAVTGVYDELEKAALDGKGGRAAGVFMAQDAAGKGDFAKAGELARKALETSPDNLSAKALHAMALFAQSGNPDNLKNTAGDLPHASTRVQAMILSLVEKSIISADPAERGAGEKEDGAGGLFGWAFDLLDDLAVWIYWMISIFLNLALNATNGPARALYWQVIEGDRLDGLRKPEKAAEKFKKALAMAPDCSEALESMVKYSIASGDFAKAQEYLDRLVTVLGENVAGDPSIRKWKADLEFFQGKYREASAIYEGLEPLFPLSYIIPYRMGFCVLAMGGSGVKAVDLFEKALSRINPGLLAERIGKLGGWQP